jgi:putative serine/threonine protein kinase
MHKACNPLSSGEQAEAESSMRTGNPLRISVNALDIEPHGYIVCYPTPIPSDFHNRLRELHELKIDEIEFSGPRHINQISILGKGTIGIVVAAYRRNEKVALKIRRVDASRETMQHEARMLERANEVHVGPRFLGVTTNFLVMEYIKGMLLPEWIETLRGKNSAPKLRGVLHSVLEQAWRLDAAGLDHGELSHAPKHIIITSAKAPCIVDFETASTSRRASNVTSLIQYLFLRSPVSTLVKKWLSNSKEDDLLRALRTYKKTRTHASFEELLRILGLRHRFSVSSQRQKVK